MAYLNEQDRQDSIQRQNALTNATNLVIKLLEIKYKDNKEELKIKESVELVKKIANELIKFHEPK